MRNLLRLLPLWVCMLWSSATFAQSKSVTGTVTSEKDGDPVSGVTITNKTTKKYTLSNSSGYYSIVAENGQVLEFSSIGFLKKQVTVGDRSTNVVLAVNTKVENEVVVTALGVKKDKRGLGYSAPEIKGAEIAETQRENFFNSIQGRVAGATVTSTGGAPGASSQIVLRGFNSISGSNSPLIIVDGLPMNNNVFDQHRLASDIDNRNNDYTNRAADLNPEDIESVTILKGPEAAALYGSEAGSGAIVIVTKKGKVQPLKVSYDNNFRSEKITKFHDIQKTYDVGTNGDYNIGARSFFGPKYLPGAQLYNNLENFFVTGKSQKHTVGLDWGRGLTSFKISGTVSDQRGVIPNTQNLRANARLTINTKVSNKFDISATGSYAYSLNKKAFRGAGGYMLNLLLWPLDDDASNFLNTDGKRRVYSKLSSGADNTAEANNAYFDVYRNLNYDRLNRVNFNVALNYDILPWVNLNWKLGADNYSQYGAYVLHPESSNAYTVFGRGEEYTNRYQGYSSLFSATAKRKVGAFNITARVGTSTDDRSTKTWGLRGDSLVNYNDITFRNFNVNDNTSKTASRRLNSRQNGRDTLTLQRSIGLFGDINIAYKEMVYLNLTGRNDILAEFPSQNRSFFFPSTSLSFVFSELLRENKILSFGKLRASIAQTGKRFAPYSNQSNYTNAVGITSTYGWLYGFTNNNPNLFPERQTTYELGTELKFLNNRVSVDLNYYNTFVDRQVVVNLRASYATGFVLNTLNVASIRNEGVEATLNLDIVKKRNTTWRSTVTFNRMWNNVTYLPANLPEYYNSDSWLAGYRASLFYNQPTTTIAGQNYLRNSKGQILIDPGTGYPLTDPNYTSIGDRNPDFVLGIGNRVRYKSIRLSFLFDVKIGGDVLNGTEQYLAQVGLSKRTLDRERSRIIPGVLQDGLQETANPTINTIPILPYFQNDYYTGRTYAVDFVEHDVNWLRLRDVSLSVDLSRKVLNKLRIFSSGSVFVTGTDLFILSNYTGPDPSVNGNTPATGGVGSFAIDYGNTATPIGINFGVRVAFKNNKK
jgi:TonB-linked SusC/RagA family outer membrane protein